MDCETADGLLIDLACGELAEADAAELRAHVAGCDDCGRALGRLEAGRALARDLPREEPRASTTAAIMAAARARAAELSAPAPAPAEEKRSVERSSEPAPAGRDPDGPWSAIVRWLGSLAMGPQVAMAMLLMLMVGIGLLYFPAERGDRVALPAVEPDPSAEHGSAGALEPAEPLPLRVDPRTRRIVPVEGEEGAGEESAGDEVATRPARSVPREAGDESGADPTVRLATADRTEEASAAGGVVEGELEGEVAAEVAAAPGEALAMAELGEGEGLGSTVAEPLPDPEPTGEAVLAMRAEAPRALETAPAPRATTPPEDEAVPPPTDALVPTALHRQARSAMRAGSLAAASRTYVDLLTRFPTYTEAPRAMLELAECERRLGRLSSAETWLTRAARHPSVAREAGQHLARVRAERRASDRAIDSESVDDHAASAETF